MSTIHQVFCTLGVGVPSGPGGAACIAHVGSLDGQDFDACWHDIQPYVYYQLPRDVSDEHRQHLTADTAPKRLFRVATAGGWDVLGQACFLPAKAPGANGNAFAHLVLQKEAEGGTRWSAVDCLKLWGAAGWVQAAAPLAGTAGPLRSLAELLGDRGPAIDDQVFLSFLTAGVEGPFHDPQAVIPPRWRQMPADRRQAWFLDLFCTFLQGGSQQQGPVCLVAEPGLAALMFYGIARLVPEGPIRESLSFSTYEPEPERAAVALAATWFADPGAAGSLPHVGAGCAAVLNTLTEPPPDAPRPRTEYATAMVSRLVEKGWPEIDWRLDTLRAVKVRKIELLETLATIEQLVENLLETGSFANQHWRKSEALTSSVRHVLLRHLQRASDLSAALKNVIGGPAHLSVLDLAASSKDPLARSVVELLLKRVPAEKFDILLKLPSIGTAEKLQAVAAYIDTQETLPPGCDWLWTEWEKSGKTGDVSKMGLLPQLFITLPLESLRKLFKNLPALRAVQAVTGLLELHRNKAITTAQLTPVIEALDENTVVALLRQRGTSLLEEYPGDEPAMGRKLAGLLRTVHQHPEEFKERLDWILAGQHLLEDERQQRVATAWANCRKGIAALGRLQEGESPAGEQSRINLMVSTARDLALAADEALTPCLFEGENPHLRKLECLRQIANELLGKPLMPPGPVEHEYLWNKIAQQLQTHQWPAESGLTKEAMKAELAAKKEGKKEPGKREAKEAPPRPEVRPLVSESKTLTYLIVGLVGLLTVAIVGAALWWFWPSAQPAKKRRPKRPGERPKAAAPAKLEADKEAAPGRTLRDLREPAAGKPTK